MNFLIKRGLGFSLPPGCSQGLGLSCPVFIGVVQNKQQAKVDIGICFVLACLITKAVIIQSIDLPTEAWILRSILKLQESPEIHIAEMKEKLDVHWVASFLVQRQRFFGFCFVWREESCQGGISMTVFTALFTNMRILKFKSQLTFAFFAAVNHLNGPLRKQNFTLTGSKGQGLWFVIGGFRCVLCFYVSRFVVCDCNL